MIRISAGVGAAGFLFLGALLLVHHVSRGSRRRFDRLFRPALVFAASGTALLGVANAFLALLTVVAATLYVFASPIERVPLEVVLLVGTVAAVWALGMAGRSRQRPPADHGHAGRTPSRPERPSPRWWMTCAGRPKPSAPSRPSTSSRAWRRRCS